MSENKSLLTSGQIRAARAFLRWSASDLAERCGLGLATVQRAEVAERVPTMTRVNMEAVRRVFEAEGVRFTSDGCVCPPPASAPH